MNPLCRIYTIPYIHVFVFVFEMMMISFYPADLLYKTPEHVRLGMPLGLCGSARFVRFVEVESQESSVVRMISG